MSDRVYSGEEFAAWADLAHRRAIARMSRHLMLMMTAGYGEAAWMERKRHPTWRRVLSWKLYRLRRMF